MFELIFGDLLGGGGFSRSSLVNAVISCGYLAAGGWLLIEGSGRGTPGLVWFAIAIVVTGSLAAWLLSWQREHLIADTPTSRIASAAQGYVEIVGRGDTHRGSPAPGFGLLPPCLWYRVRVSRRDGHGRRRYSETRRSEDTFVISDDSGTCVVDPDHSEVITSHTRSWWSGEFHYKAWYLAPGDTVYALGDLRTEGGAGTPLDPAADVRALLRQWKRDQAGLLARFDTDGDGEIDVREWQGARRDARAEVERRHLEMRLRPGIHVLRAPADGRPFLLSNRDPERLARRYRWWSRFHVAVFVATSVGALLWWHRHGLG